MANLIKPATMKVITKDGEVQVTIALDINININQGMVQGVVSEQSISPVPAEPVKKEETPYLIPSFKSGNKIKFGKPVEE